MAYGDGGFFVIKSQTSLETFAKAPAIFDFICGGSP